jgi:NAD(P)-dependent dehydrogenase (short-subunit alcohol dehydrogenase family)
MTLLNQLFSLDGQVAIVTGGTRVLGGAIARGVAQAGAKVGLGRAAYTWPAARPKSCQPQQPKA